MVVNRTKGKERKKKKRKQQIQINQNLIENSNPKTIEAEAWSEKLFCSFTLSNDWIEEKNREKEMKKNYVLCFDSVRARTLSYLRFYVDNRS